VKRHRKLASIECDSHDDGAYLIYRFPDRADHKETTTMHPIQQPAAHSSFHEAALNHPSTRHRLSALSLACALALAAGAAQAQDTNRPAAQPGAATGNTSERIVVTARKRAELVIDVPLAVSVVGGDQLERDQISNLTDLARTSPSLEVSQSFGGETNGGGRLRGIGTGVFNASVSPSVALVVDQVPIGNLAFPLLFDVSAVEVLRGPQGTLFGQGASAGVINIRSRAPSTTGFAARGGVQYADKGKAGSEFGEQVFDASINVPLNDRMALRLATQHRVETGLQRRMNAAGGQPAGKDTELTDVGVRLRFLMKPTDNIQVNLGAEYGKNESDGQVFLGLAIPPNATTPFGAPGGTLGGASLAAHLNPTGCAMTEISLRTEQYCEAAPTYLETEISGLSAVVDITLSDALSVTSVTGLRERTYRQFRREFTRLSTVPSAARDRVDEDAEGLSQELRASYAGDGFDLTFGLAYASFDFESHPQGNPPFTFGLRGQADRIGFGVCTLNGAVCPLPPAFTKEITSNRTLSAFTDATVKLPAKLQLFGGLRVDDFKNTTRTGTNTLTPTASLETTDRALSGRIGLSWQPVKNSNLYASLSRGYKPPAVGTNAAGGLFELLPEESDAIELGAKLFTRNVQWTANIFSNTLKNYQGQTSIFVGTALISTPLNVPKLEARGLEFTATGDIGKNLNFSAGYQFNKVEYPAGFLGEDGQSLGGRQFLLAPEHKVSLSAEYSFAVAGGVEGFVNANVIHKSKTLYGARTDPRYVFPAHEIVNVGFGLKSQDGRWNASVFVRNLAKERQPMTLVASTFAGQTDGGIRSWPVAGLTARAVGIRAGFNF
jgi:iron complex outermembrane recepter protein